MKFNLEEIALCKKIAEKHRKEISKGDWFALPGDNFVKDAKELFARKGIQFIEICGKGYTIDVYSEPYSTSPEKQLKWAYVPIPLWQISDCLKFIKSKGYRVLLDESSTMVEPFEAKCYGHKANQAFHSYGDSYFEACLKAVLAIVEEP